MGRVDDCQRQQADPSFVIYLDFFGGPDFFRNTWDPQHPLTTPNGLADPVLAVQSLEIAAQQFQDAGVPLDIEWGAIARNEAARRINRDGVAAIRQASLPRCCS
jgi:hypothetical protein